MIHVNEEVRRMLKEVAGVLNEARVPYAVGGAVAMALYGVRRATMDVDIFSLESAKRKVLRALRNIGYEIEPAGAPFLYLAYPPWQTSGRDVRVDLLFPADEPDISGVETAQNIEVEPGLKVKVFSLVMLTLSRLYSDQPRHRTDLYLLHERGLLPVEEAMEILEEYDPRTAREFQELVEDMVRPTRRGERPRRWKHRGER
jgi:hypothetical protein